MYQFFLILGKMFQSKGFYVFALLVNPQTSKYMTSSQILLHISNYNFNYSLGMFVSMKMKFG